MQIIFFGETIFRCALKLQSQQREKKYPTNRYTNLHIYVLFVGCCTDDSETLFNFCVFPLLFYAFSFPPILPSLSPALSVCFSLVVVVLLLLFIVSSLSLLSKHAKSWWYTRKRWFANYSLTMPLQYKGLCSWECCVSHNLSKYTKYTIKKQPTPISMTRILRRCFVCSAYIQ